MLLTCQKLCNVSQTKKVEKKKKKIFYFGFSRLTIKRNVKSMISLRASTLIMQTRTRIRTNIVPKQRRI